MTKKKVRPRNKAKALKLVKSLISNDLSQAETARELGVTQQAIHNQIVNNPIVRTALQAYQEELEKAGATDIASAKVIADAMQAERTVAVEDYTEEEESDDQFNKKGKIFRHITEADHAIRLKANEQYLKVKKLLSDSTPAPAGGNHIHFHLGEKTDDELVKDIRSQMAAFGPGKPSNPGRSAGKGKG